MDAISNGPRTERDDFHTESQSVTVHVGNVLVVKDGSTGLNDSNSDVVELRQAVGNDETAGATTNDDVVILGRGSRGRQGGSRKEGRGCEDTVHLARDTCVRACVRACVCVCVFWRGCWDRLALLGGGYIGSGTGSVNPASRHRQQVYTGVFQHIRDSGLCHA